VVDVLLAIKNFRSFDDSLYRYSHSNAERRLLIGMDFLCAGCDVVRVVCVVVLYQCSLCSIVIDSKYQYNDAPSVLISPSLLFAGISRKEINLRNATECPDFSSFVSLNVQYI